MTDSRILIALGLPPAASDGQVARHMRALARLPERACADSALWARFVHGVELARDVHGRGPRGDLALLANGIVEYAIVPPGEPGEDRYGTVPWDRELGVDFAEADPKLRRLVFEEIGPRLSEAGLYRLL